MHTPYKIQDFDIYKPRGKDDRLFITKFFISIPKTCKELFILEYVKIGYDPKTKRMLIANCLNKEDMFAVKIKKIGKYRSYILIKEIIKQYNIKPQKILTYYYDAKFNGIIFQIE